MSMTRSRLDPVQEPWQRATDHPGYIGRHGTTGASDSMRSLTDRLRAARTCRLVAAHANPADAARLAELRRWILGLGSEQAA